MLFFFLQWKGDSEIVYNYSLSSKRKRPFSARSGGSQQPPAKRASAYKPPSDQSAVSKIVQLLHEVEELSVIVPTVADRLTRISNVFPNAHLPIIDFLNEVSGHDQKILDALKLAVSALQSGYSEFGAKQDAFCSHYEREAVTADRQSSEEDVGCGRGDRMHDPVLGQSAAEAEVGELPFSWRPRTPL